MFWKFIRGLITAFKIVFVVVGGAVVIAGFVFLMNAPPPDTVESPPRDTVESQYYTQNHRSPFVSLDACMDGIKEKSGDRLHEPYHDTPTHVQGNLSGDPDRTWSCNLTRTGTKGTLWTGYWQTYEKKQ